VVQDGGLGKDKEPSNFTDVNKVQYAPVICYESVFGEYVTDYVKKVQMLFVL